MEDKAIHTKPGLANFPCIPVVPHWAQGSGGSFKDRTPIGEVGCCESWMAAQIH